MIPVHEPQIGSLEMSYVAQALRAGEVSGSGGSFLREFEKKFARYCECDYGIAVSSGSTALHLAAVLAGIRRGDEVLVSSLTNIATANAVVQQGGVVVAIDSEPDTWNMDVTQLERHITPKTRAIFPVHIYGHPVDMIPVVDSALRHGLFIVEDCAEAHGATYRNQPVGSIGNLGCFSFYANKVITTGEGGMIVTNDHDLYERACSLRNLAFGRPRFLHEELGYNYRMTNLQAALGLGQFNRIESIIHRKRWIASEYTKRLKSISNLQLPIEQSWAHSVYWMYCIVVKEQSRDLLMEKLYEAGIETRTMFCPMNLQPSLLKLGAVRGDCPVAEYLWHHGLYLPSGNGLTEEEIEYICDVIDSCV